MDSAHCQAVGGGGSQAGQAGTIWLGGTDFNVNGVRDGCDIFSGTSSDGNSDGIPDDAETSANSTIATLEFNTMGQLMLRWAHITGFSQYIIYAQHGTGAVTALATVSSSPYDMTPLLGGTNTPDVWKFYVCGYRP
jgi:hypothetical protein